MLIDLPASWYEEWNGIPDFGTLLGVRLCTQPRGWGEQELEQEGEASRETAQLSESDKQAVLLKS